MAELKLVVRPISSANNGIGSEPGSEHYDGVGQDVGKDTADWDLFPSARWAAEREAKAEPADGGQAQDGVAVFGVFWGAGLRDDNVLVLTSHDQVTEVAECNELGAHNLDDRILCDLLGGRGQSRALLRLAFHGDSHTIRPSVGRRQSTPMRNGILRTSNGRACDHARSSAR